MAGSSKAPGRQSRIADVYGDTSGETTAPGKKTLIQRAYGGGESVQRRGGASPHPTPSRDPDAVKQNAAEGLQGGAGPLPHLDTIQASFGAHDVSGVGAHVGGGAATACDAIAADAYASGDQVAFRSAPDLHTAAHEAAHVVQQRGGVQLAGGVGEVGDSYERHADAVADRVVQGHSAADLLGPVPVPGGSSATQLHPVQREGGESEGGESEGGESEGGGAGGGMHLQDEFEQSGFTIEYDLHVGGTEILVINSIAISHGDHRAEYSQEAVSYEHESLGSAEISEDSVAVRANVLQMIPFLREAVEQEHWHIRFFIGGTAHRVEYEGGSEWVFDPEFSLQIGAEVGGDETGASGSLELTCSDETTPFGSQTHCETLGSAEVNVLGHEVYSREDATLAEGSSNLEPPDHGLGNLVWWWVLASFASGDDVTGTLGSDQRTFQFAEGALDWFGDSRGLVSNVTQDVNAYAREQFAALRGTYEAFYDRSIQGNVGSGLFRSIADGQGILHPWITAAFAAESSRYPSYERVREELRTRGE